MTFLTANGLSFWVERSGEGPPLLSISGTGGDLRQRALMPPNPLTEGFTVVAYDQRGLGRSEKPDGPYAMADYANDAAGLLDALGLPKAHVMGVSFGGMVALELACRHPGRIDKLVLCCTSAGGAGGSSHPLHEMVGLAPAERAARMIPILDRRHDEAWASSRPDAHAALVRMMTEDPFVGEPRRALGARLQLEARAGHDVWDRLSGIEAETLICAGRYDGQAPPENQHALAGRIPRARLLFFEGGHLFLLEDPAAYSEIAAFLQA